MLVKVLGREARIPRLVERLDLSGPIRVDTLPRGLAKPPVHQARFAVVLITLAPASKRPLSNPQKLAASN